MTRHAGRQTLTQVRAILARYRRRIFARLSQQEVALDESHFCTITLPM